MRNLVSNVVTFILIIVLILSIFFLGYCCGLKETEDKAKPSQQECFIPHMNDYGIDARDYQVELIDDGSKMVLILYSGNSYITEISLSWDSQAGKRILKDNL